MKMREIIKDNVVLARYIEASDIRKGLNFFSEDKDFIQVGVWGQYEKDKELKAHIHNEVTREATRTYEALYVVNGSFEATIYTLNEEIIETLTVRKGDILILLECGHGYKILEDNTVVLECKNGPYLGAESDRRRI